MKIFVGFGYNENDKWIIEHIIPFIESLGCDVVTGEKMQGESLSNGVLKRINNSDACLGFLTKRGTPNDEGVFGSHIWVYQELAAARTRSIPLFEIREKGVDPQKGIIGDLQRFEFDDKISIFKEITSFILNVKTENANKLFMFLPKEFSEEIKDVFQFAKCEYTFMHRGKFYNPEATELIDFHGGFGILLKKIPDEEASVNIKIESQKGKWSSGFIPVGVISTNLKKI
jgi:hypothetical protein